MGVKQKTIRYLVEVRCDADTKEDDILFDLYHDIKATDCVTLVTIHEVKQLKIYD